MIKIENVEVVGLEHAIRGMRNPKNSWHLSDTVVVDVPETLRLDYSGNIVDMIPAHKMVITKCTDGKWEGIGENDFNLMKRLAKGGPVHAKYRRMIAVYMDVTCHHTWWAEFDTYKVSTVRNSCSKMHKIHVKEFVKDDFSTEGIDECSGRTLEVFEIVKDELERLRVLFNETGEKKYWRAIIELLPMGFNIKATIMLNYEVLHNIYTWRNSHKVFEWVEFCKWIKTLPYSEIITGSEKELICNE